MITYNKLLNKQMSYNFNEKILSLTIFHKTSWPLFSFYMDSQINHNKIVRSISLLVNLFYKYLIKE